MLRLQEAEIILRRDISLQSAHAPHLFRRLAGIPFACLVIVHLQQGAVVCPSEQYGFCTHYVEKLRERLVELYKLMQIRFISDMIYTYSERLFFSPKKSKRV